MVTFFPVREDMIMFRNIMILLVSWMCLMLFLWYGFIRSHVNKWLYSKAIWVVLMRRLCPFVLSNLAWSKSIIFVWLTDYGFVVLSRSVYCLLYSDSTFFRLTSFVIFRLEIFNIEIIRGIPNFQAQTILCFWIWEPLWGISRSHE